MSRLFDPLTLGSLTLENRIVVSPMAQYSAEDHAFSDWHVIHLGMLAGSGAGLVMIEATSVDPVGLCTQGDPALYDDRTEAALRNVVGKMRKAGKAKIGIQLGHGGRKASTRRHWEGGQGLTPEEGAWQTVAPSALAFGANPAPRALEPEEIAEIVGKFGDAAGRAVRAGVDVIELHAAHGYLLHQFHSPITNRRTDAYGGTPEKRRRLILECFEAVRRAASAATVGIRATASDWIEGGIGIDDLISLAGELETLGCDYIDVTSGGLDPAQQIALGPLYQVEFARAVKAATTMPVRAVGLIATPEDAERVIAEGKADQVALARAFLANPHWAWLAAQRLGADVAIPEQYLRAAPQAWPGWAMAAGQ